MWSRRAVFLKWTKQTDWVSSGSRWSKRATRRAKSLIVHNTREVTEGGWTSGRVGVRLPKGQACNIRAGSRPSPSDKSLPRQTLLCSLSSLNYSHITLPPPPVLNIFLFIWSPFFSANGMSALCYSLSSSHTDQSDLCLSTSAQINTHTDRKPHNI